MRSPLERAAERPDQHQPRQRAAGLRRLRSGRAGAQLGRFQGPGRPRQAARRARQRSRFRRRRDGDFGGKAMTYYGRWTYKYEEAATPRRRRRADRPRDRARLLRLEHRQELQHQHACSTSSGRTRRRSHTPFESWIQRPLAEQIFAASGLNFDQAKAAAKTRDFQPIPLKATLSAERPGAGRDDHFAQCRRLSSGQEISRRDGDLFGALGPSRHRQAGRPRRHIYNGALDNATGISQLIEQARAFAREPRTDRSVVFLAVTAEEKGLLGSEYYAPEPALSRSARRPACSTPTAGRSGARRRTSPSPATPSSTCSTI